jgi:hypothetical protein
MSRSEAKTAAHHGQSHSTGNGNGATASHGTHQRAQPPEANSTGSDAPPLHKVWRFARAVPGVFQGALKTHPMAVVAGVGAGGFVLGALCGSRVGRMLVTTAVGYGLNRLVVGAVGREIGHLASELVKNGAAAN